MVGYGTWQVSPTIGITQLYNIIIYISHIIRTRPGELNCNKDFDEVYITTAAVAVPCVFK